MNGYEVLGYIFIAVISALMLILTVLLYKKWDEVKTDVLDFVIPRREMMVKVPGIITLLILFSPMIVELLKGNLFFFQDWYNNNTFMFQYMVKAIMGPDRLFYALHILVIALIFGFIYMMIKLIILDYTFPTMVLERDGVKSYEKRVIWYTGNSMEDRWKEFQEARGKTYEPKVYSVWVIKYFSINIINPKLSLLRIELPDKRCIKERLPKELIIEDTGIMNKMSTSHWKMSFDTTKHHKTDSGKVFKYIDSLLVELTDKTSKSAKADPHIRKKVIMDSTYTQASSIAPNIKDLIDDIREKREVEKDE